ncbi:MAG: hypothetical protein P9M11_12070 [Candidatus Tenebribacter burtonii]|jgi:uncharacterized iron-regulated protein|nr:hypothetical protein [Candidatus Tenebribacter burtonii]
MSKKGQKWSTKEISYLRKHASSTSTKLIARNLNRSVSAVYNKASDLKTSLKPKDK